MKIPRREVPSLEKVEEKRTNLFFERIRTALQNGKFQTETPIVDRLLAQGFSATDIAGALVQELRKEDAARRGSPSAKRREDHTDSQPPHPRPRDRGSRQPRS